MPRYINIPEAVTNATPFKDFVMRLLIRQPKASASQTVSQAVTAMAHGVVVLTDIDWAWLCDLVTNPRGGVGTPPPQYALFLNAVLTAGTQPPV